MVQKTNIMEKSKGQQKLTPLFVIHECSDHSGNALIMARAYVVSREHPKRRKKRPGKYLDALLRYHYAPIINDPHFTATILLRSTEICLCFHCVLAVSQLMGRGYMRVYQIATKAQKCVWPHREHCKGNTVTPYLHDESILVSDANSFLLHTWCSHYALGSVFITFDGVQTTVLPLTWHIVGVSYQSGTESSLVSYVHHALADQYAFITFIILWHS